MSKGSLKLRFGPMFSGKTTWLDGELNEFSRNGWKCLKIVHLNDKKRIYSSESTQISGNNKNEDTSSEFPLKSSSGYTHNPHAKMLDENIDVIFVPILTTTNVENYHIIAIDEGQFFPDLTFAVKTWVQTKHLLVVGLDGNSNKERFGHILDLIPLADEALKINAKCSLCMNELKDDVRFHGNIMNLPAPFSKRIVADQAEVLVGGADKYIATCRFHHS